MAENGMDLMDMLEMTGNGWKWLDMNGMTGHERKLLTMGEYNLKLLKMAGYGSHGWK